MSSVSSVKQREQREQHECHATDRNCTRCGTGVDSHCPQSLTTRSQCSNALSAAHSCPAIAKLPIWAGVSPIALTLVTLSLPTLVLSITPSCSLRFQCSLTALSLLTITVSLLTLILTWLFWQLHLRPGSERHKPDRTDRLQGTRQTRRWSPPTPLSSNS